MNVERVRDTSIFPSHWNITEADNALIPEFRVVLVSKKRRGIKLESLYWRLLGEIAERRGLKRTRLVASIIEAAEPGSGNTSSVLRCFVARTLDDDLSAMVGHFSEKSIIDLLQQAPIPTFAINRQKRLYQVNPEFIQMLRVLGGNMAQKIPADGVQLTLGTPIEELFVKLAKTGSTNCNYSIHLEDRQRQGRVRVVAVPPSPHSMLVGYIVS